MGVASERQFTACGGHDGDDVHIDLDEVCRPDDGNGIIPPRPRPSSCRPMTKLIAVTCMVLFAISMGFLAEYIARPPTPTPFLVLARADGLDPGPSSSPPAFRLEMGVVGLAQQYYACVGGGGSVLEVSYHGMAVAMGRVPQFCVDGLGVDDERADGVVTVVAGAEATSVREELRGLIRSERQIVGAAEFNVEGEIKGMGYLRCKALWFRDDKRRSPIPLCQVEA